MRMNMDYLRIDASRMEALWKLQKLYKAEIGEAEPDSAGKGTAGGSHPDRKHPFLRRF